MTDKLSYDDAKWIIDQLQSFMDSISGYNLKQLLLRGWLNELKTNALQRSVNRAYACDIDLVHYGFDTSNNTKVAAFHELKFSKKRIEFNKQRLQSKIADKLGIPFYFSQVLDADTFLVQDVSISIQDNKKVKPLRMDYEEWGKWQQDLSRFIYKTNWRSGNGTPVIPHLNNTKLDKQF